MRHELENLGYVPHPAELHSAQGLDAAQPDGVDVQDLPIGAVLEVETGHTKYVLENRGQGQVVLSGHPQYCPEPVLVKFHGSIGGQALLKMGRIEPGMKMAFQHPKFGSIRTSNVRSIRAVKVGAPH
jgi:hypothetical protein